MTSAYKYVFPAIKGIQAGREYYVAMCPLKLLPKIFLFDEQEIPPELRAQRIINKSRIPDIKNYLVNNPNDYVFSAITASIDGELIFTPSNNKKELSDIGQLEISMSAKFVINDGQHRRAAVEAALEENPKLGEETIAVVFFLDEHLRRSQQLFSDLNQHAIRPSKSLNILYNNRDPLACLSRELMVKVPLFMGLTEKEKTTISNRSLKLFTLSGIYHATGALLGKAKNQDISSKEEKMAVDFWSEMGQVIPEWILVIERNIRSHELRQDYVHSHNVILHALGFAGKDLIETHPKDWKKVLKKYQEINWSRDNTIWEGRAMIAGRMSKAVQNVRLTSNLLKMQLDLDLTPTEQELEELFRHTNLKE